MKVNEIRKLADASNRGLREINPNDKQRLQAEALIHAAQWLAEIAAQLAEVNERAAKPDTFEFGGYTFRRDAILGVVPLSARGECYSVEMGMVTNESGLTLYEDSHPRADFVKAWRGE